MNKKPFIIIGSARKNSETRRFLTTVFSNTDHHLKDLLDHPVAYYDYSHNYPEHDEFFSLVDELLEHDAIIFATPVYWYTMSALMKTFFDRFTDLVTIAKQKGRQLKGKTIFLIATGAEKELPDGFENPFKMTADYLDMNYGGCIYHSIEYTKDENELQSEIRVFLEKVRSLLNT